MTNHSQLPSIQSTTQIYLFWISYYMCYVRSEVEVTQSCQILCNPMDYSPQCSFAYGISQARIMEWVAILFSICIMLFVNLEIFPLVLQRNLQQTIYNKTTLREWLNLQQTKKQQISVTKFQKFTKKSQWLNWRTKIKISLYVMHTLRDLLWQKFSSISRTTLLPWMILLLYILKKWK